MPNSDVVLVFARNHAHILPMPFAIIFLLFIFLEIAGFVAMAEAIGLLGVFGLVIAGIFAGGLIIRTIGLASVRRMQERADAGETVGQELGGLVLGFLGGLLLIVPGFLTDLLGLLLLIKPVQMLVWPRYGRQMADRMPPMGAYGGGQAQWRSPGRGEPSGSSTNASQPNTSSVVIDAEPVDPAGSERETSDPRPNQTRSDNPWG
ncbi:MAG: FxsA family protein [Pseudomonadota bacterium]